jgi:hypothetical protein
MSAQRPSPQTTKAQKKQQQHLDTLKTLINTIVSPPPLPSGKQHILIPPAQLIETGKALRSANSRGAKSISHDNDRLQMYMPKAISTFHGALDELESDIVRVPGFKWKEKY